MGFFSTSKSDVDETLNLLRMNVDHTNWRDNYLSQLEKYARKETAFRDQIVDTMQNYVTEVAFSNVGSAAAIISSLFKIAGEDEASKTKVIQKVVLAYPTFVSQLSRDTSLLPKIIDEGLAASKAKVDDKLFFIMKTCDVLAPIAAANPSMAQGLVPKLLLAAENDVTVPQDLIPGFYDDDDATKDQDKKQNMTLRTYIVRKAVDLLPALSVQDSKVTNEVVKSMLFSTAFDPKLKSMVVRKATHTLPTLAQSNPKVVFDLVQNMLTATMADEILKNRILQKGIDVLNVMAVSDAGNARGMLQYVMTAAGSGDMKKPILEKGCDILPTLATNDTSNAFALVQTMLSAALDDKFKDTHKRIIMTACDFLPGLASRDGNNAIMLVQSLLTASPDKDIRKTVIEKACDVLPSILKYDNGRAFALMQNMLSTVAGEPDIGKIIVEKARDMIPSLATERPGVIGDLFAMILPAATREDAAALKSTILAKTFFAMTSSVTDDGTARALYEKMSTVIADDKALRKDFIEKSTESFVTLAGKHMPALKESMVKNLLATTAADADLTSLLITKTLADLPAIAGKQPRFAYDLVDNLLKAAGGAVETKKTIVEAAGAILPTILAQDVDTAQLLRAKLAATAGEGGVLKKAFTDSAVKVLADMALKNSTVTLELLKDAMNVAGNDNALKLPVLETACDMLPIVVPKMDWPTITLVKEILAGASIDIMKPAVYKELAIAPLSPQGNTRTIVFPQGDALEKTIILGDSNYLNSKYKTCVLESANYRDYSNVKQHYKSVFNFIANSEQYMNDSVSLKDIIRDKFSGETPKGQPKKATDWPALTA